MDKYDFPQVIDRLNGLAEVYNVKPPSDAGTKAWWFALRSFASGTVLTALDSWANTKSKMPTPADIVGTAKSRTSSADIDHDGSYAYWLSHQDLPEQRAGREERWLKWAKKYGLDPALTGKPRFDALSVAFGYGRKPKPEPIEPEPELAPRTEAGTDFEEDRYR